MRSFGAFWGCFIQGRFPFMEKSIRLVLDELGFGFSDLDGFTCCPEKSLIMNHSEEVWLLTAARNLSLADAAGVDLFSPCNGCAGTLKGARAHLLASPQLLRSTNARLAEIGHTFTGQAQVLHLIEVLHDQIGPDLIARHVSRPLTGMRVAVHAGCHQMRPSEEVKVDSPMSPRKFENIVRALGAEVVDYPSKLLCCGGTMNTAGLVEDAREMTRYKLRELAEIGVDVLTVVCPACFMQYDLAQFDMERQGHHYGVPVAALSELIALAFGLPLAELGLELHRIDVRPVLERWAQERQREAEVMELPLEQMAACVECQACSRNCEVHKMDPSYDPWAIFTRVLEGDLDGALRDPGLFKCVECYECHELCYQRWGMVHGIQALKHLALDRGLAPETVTASVDNFLHTGLLTRPSSSRRAKLGLPEVGRPGTEELRKLLGVQAEARAKRKSPEGSSGRRRANQEGE